MPTKQEIISGLSPTMRNNYRILMTKAAKSGGVLVWSGNPDDSELEIINSVDLTNEAFMQGKVVLYDWRK